MTRITGSMFCINCGESFYVEDEERFENLKNLCELVDNLVVEIDNICYINQNRKEYSIKKISDYAEDFLKNTLGVSE